ncbi:MAG: DUF2795 domain-containing protein [bacterium]|nr:DUF2795 domain-containing protein [bacterium]
MDWRENERASPASMQEFLNGIDYPATRDDLLEQAEMQETTPDIMYVIAQLPDEEYSGPQDVSKAVGEVE